MRTLINWLSRPYPLVGTVIYFALLVFAASLAFHRLSTDDGHPFWNPFMIVTFIMIGLIALKSIVRVLKLGGKALLFQDKSTLFLRK